MNVIDIFTKKNRAADENHLYGFSALFNTEETDEQKRARLIGEDLEHYSKASHETATQLLTTFIHVIDRDEEVCNCEGECWRWRVSAEAEHLLRMLKAEAK